MTTILRVREPREILAYVPYQLGFSPRRSVALISLRGPRQRVGLIARSDLSDMTGQRSGELAASLVHCVRRDGGESLLVVVYADGDVRDAMPAVEHVAGAVQQAAAADIDVGGVWLVTDDAFHVCGWDGEHVVDWDLPGHATSELQDTEVGATMVLRGQTIAPSREAMAEVPAVPQRRLRAAQAAGSRYWRLRGADRDRWRLEAVELWCEVLAAAAGGASGGTARPGSEGPAAPVGRLAASLRDVVVRDAVLAQAVLRGIRGDVPDVHGPGTDVVHDAMSLVLDPVVGRSPDPGALRSVVGVVETVAGHATRAGAAEAFAVLAVLAWWEGSGARARLLAAAALQRVPANRLALLVEQVLDGAVPPGWAARGAAPRE